MLTTKKLLEMSQNAIFVSEKSCAALPIFEIYFWIFLDTKFERTKRNGFHLSLLPLFYTHNGAPTIIYKRAFLKREEQLRS
jgi:hypothetical protein